MGYRKCPICELNWIKDDEGMCPICAQKENGIPVDRPMIKHKGKNVIMVFQGKDFRNELLGKYIWAPCEDKAGHSPSHWTMLENIKPGDIIFHGLLQCISAVSVATSDCFSSKIKDGVTKGMQVNCRTVFTKNTIMLRDYSSDIIRTCNNYKYQPFDKNGNGRQGYLFDLNDELSGIFARELVKKNANLIQQLPEINELLKL